MVEILCIEAFSFEDEKEGKDICLSKTPSNKPIISKG